MHRALALVGLAALLASCASPEPAPTVALVPERPVASRTPDPCDLLLDPVTKNTDIVDLYYRLDRRILEPGADKVVVTLPLDHTWDAQKGVAVIPTDPLQGDMIFFDQAAQSGGASTLATYTLVTDATLPVNRGSYPAPQTLGPPGGPRVSKGARYGVALTDLDPRNGGWASAKGGLAVPLTPAQAKKGYGRLSVKIVAELAPTGILGGTEVHRATATTGEWEVELRYVAARTMCAAIVTASDGETVKRLK